MKKDIAKYQRVAFSYAKEHGFDQCSFEEEKCGYMIFNVWNKADVGACIGYPQYVIVDKDMNVMIAGLDDFLFNGLLSSKKRI